MRRVPDLNDEISSDIIDVIFEENKYQYNQKLFSKINSKEFNDKDFKDIVKDKKKYKTGRLNSIRDNNIFEINSVKLIYSMPINSFLLVADDKEKIYLLKILGNETNSQNDREKIFLQTKDKIINEIYSSYDKFLNQNYKVEINYNTLQRTENYFK